MPYEQESCFTLVVQLEETRSVVLGVVPVVGVLLRMGFSLFSRKSIFKL